MTKAAFELALSWAPHSVLSLLASSMPCILLLGLECSLLLLSSSFRPQPSALSLQDVVPEAESVAPQQQLSQPAPLLREPLLTLVPSRGPVPGEESARRVSAGWMNGAHTLSCQLLPAPLQWSVRTTEPSRHVRPFRAGPCLPALLSSVSQGLRPCPLLSTLGTGPLHSQGVTCWGSLAPSQPTRSPLPSALAGWVQSARC